MERLSDGQLLREFATTRSEAAFAELVRRRTDLVYSAAFRMVRDGHLAQDVTQRVFVALAGSSAELAGHPVLSGWLHRTTRNIAAETIRTETRRRAREEEAAMMNESDRATVDARWEDVAPHIDDAINELPEADRDALFLRYFESKSAAEIAQVLKINDQAAQKRVQRALSRLRDLVARRGVPVGAGSLATLLGANAVQAVPAGFAVSMSGALAAGSLSTAVPSSVIPTLAMTTIQKAIITAILSGTVFTGIYQARKASKLADEVATLQAQNAPLAARVAELEGQNLALSNRLQAAPSTPALPSPQLSELMRLRDRVTRAQDNSQEVARLKEALKDQKQLPDYMTNAMAMGLTTAENWKKKDSAEQLARMKEMLRLSDSQVAAIGTIMTNHIARQSQMALEMMTGKLSAEQIRERRASGTADQQAEIRALLTPEQLEQMPAYERAENQRGIETLARSEAQQVVEQFNLSPEQQEQIRSRFLEVNIEQPFAPTHSPEQTLELQTRKLEQKCQLLEAFLTPDQLAAYRKTQLNRLQMQAAALKMVVPEFARDAKSPQ